MAVPVKLHRMVEGKKAVLFGKCCECGLQFGAGDVESFAALLALGVVMVRGENLAQLYLVFEAVPDAVHDAELFVELDGAVYGGAVNVFLQLCRKYANIHWPMLSQMRKNR